MYNDKLGCTQTLILEDSLFCAISDFIRNVMKLAHFMSAYLWMSFADILPHIDKIYRNLARAFRYMVFRVCKCIYIYKQVPICYTILQKTRNFRNFLIDIRTVKRVNNFDMRISQHYVGLLHVKLFEFEASLRKVSRHNSKSYIFNLGITQFCKRKKAVSCYDEILTK